MSDSSFDGVDRSTRFTRPAAALGTARLDRALKRGFDLALAVLLLIVLLPILLACCIAIKVESRGPVFFRARRAGWNGTTLDVLKFRKMHHGATGQSLTGVADSRFTRIGRLLARTKLDELPQLWNVVRGQMSLVGPRPEDPRFVRLHEDDYGVILTARPGVTGLCQLAFAKETEILDTGDRLGHYVDRIFPQKVHLDLLYASSRTLRGDIWILAWTVLPVLLRRDVAVNRVTGELTVRRRSARTDSTPGR